MEHADNYTLRADRVPDVTPDPDPGRPLVSAAEEAMEALRPSITLCNCHRCGLPMVGARSGKTVQRMKDAERRLFPSQIATQFVAGRPACRSCIAELAPKRAAVRNLPAPFARNDPAGGSNV